MELTMQDYLPAAVIPLLVLIVYLQVTSSLLLAPGHSTGCLAWALLVSLFLSIQRGR